MSHTPDRVDKLLIKPTAGARPAPPCRPDRSLGKARPRRPVTRRVTSSSTTPGWQQPQTDQPTESHSHPRGLRGRSAAGSTGVRLRCPALLGWFRWRVSGSLVALFTVVSGSLVQSQVWGANVLARGACSWGTRRPSGGHAADCEDDGNVRGSGACSSPSRRPLSRAPSTGRRGLQRPRGDPLMLASADRSPLGGWKANALWVRFAA